jgi:hypothetical protein
MSKFLPFTIRITGLFLLVALSTVFAYYGQEIAFEKQWPLYDGLRNTSAIIFGVMGAWVALIYPEAIASMLDSKENPVDQHRVKAAHRVLSALVISACILATILLVGIFSPIFRQIPWMAHNFRFFRGLSYVILGIMTAGQLWTVLLTLLPADQVKHNLDYALSRKKNKSIFLSQVQFKTSNDPEKNSSKSEEPRQ